MSISELTALIRDFCAARDWHQFHNPKDMAIAISLEASELLEHFLWKNPDEVSFRAKERRTEMTHEIADIAIYLFELADNLGIDLAQAIKNKLIVNAEKYPVGESKGSSRKYDELRET